MSEKHLHELTELMDIAADDLVLVSRNEVEFKQKRSVLLGGLGLTLDYAISTAIAVAAAGQVAITPGDPLVGHNDFEGDIFDYDLGLFTSPAASLFAFELEINATSLVADGAGPLTLLGLANGGDRQIAKQVIASSYATQGGNLLWQGRFCTVALLDEDEDFYFAVSRAGAPAASVTGGTIRIVKLG